MEAVFHLNPIPTLFPFPFYKLQLHLFLQPIIVAGSNFFHLIDERFFFFFALISLLMMIYYEDCLDLCFQPYFFIRKVWPTWTNGSNM